MYESGIFKSLPISLDGLMTALDLSEPKEAVTRLIASNERDVPRYRQGRRAGNMTLMVEEFVEFINHISDQPITKADDKYFGRSALEEACYRGYNQFIPFLLMCLAVAGETVSFKKAVKAYQHSEKKSLLPKTPTDLGEILNRQSDTRLGNTCLHYAAESKHVATVDLLLSHGADINARNKQAYTPLHAAVVDKNSDMTKSLVTAGADQSLRANDDHAPIHKALHNLANDCVPLLMASHDLRGPRGNTTLHVACLARNAAMATYLLKQGLSADIQNDAGDTPLHLACQMKHLGLIECLLEQEAGVNQTNEKNETPLHRALTALGAEVDSPLGKEIVTRLIASGADKEARDGQGRVPSDLIAAVTLTDAGGQEARRLLNR